MGLSAKETKRYARHIVLKGIGGSGQQKLKAARVLVVGAGGLGSPLIAYLAAAGVGTIGIVDDDDVALSNLQRQIVHRDEGIGASKAASAAQFALALNPDIIVDGLVQRFDADTGAALLAGYDMIADGTDSLRSRRAIADAAEAAGLPLVSGAVSMFDGQVSVLAPHLNDSDGHPHPRFVDLYPQTLDSDALPSCEAVGVLGAVTGVIGTLMAMEIIKLITGVGEPLIGRLLLYDGKGAKFSELQYARKI